MFKAIWHEKQILIVLLWSALIFIGYNILTVQADEKEDMAKNIRDMKFVNDDLDAGGLKDMAIEQECKDNGGQWKDKSWCKFDKDKTGDEVEFEHQLADRGLDNYYGDMLDAGFGGEEFDKYQQEKYEKQLAEEKEIAAKEDALCDNEDADTTDIKKCMSEERLQQSAFNIDKEECKEVNGEWKKDRCTYYEDEQAKQEEKKEKESIPNAIINPPTSIEYDDEPNPDYKPEEEEEVKEEEEEEADDSSSDEYEESSDESEEEEEESDDSSSSESEE